MSSSFEKSLSIFSCVIALELVDFICQAVKPLAQYSKISVDLLKQPLLVKESKFGLLTMTVAIFSLEEGKTKTIEHKFKEPTGIAFLSVLDVLAVCDSSKCALVLFDKTGEGVFVINFPKKISPIHVPSLQGVRSGIFLTSSTSMLYKMKVTLNARKDGRNSSAVMEVVGGYRPHPTHSIEDGPAA